MVIVIAARGNIQAPFYLVPLDLCLLCVPILMNNLLRGYLKHTK
jgi:hypothetical protein